MRRLAFLLGFLIPGILGAQTVPVRLGGGLSSFTGVPFDVPIEVDWSARADRLGSFTTVPFGSPRSHATWSVSPNV